MAFFLRHFRKRKAGELSGRTKRPKVHHGGDAAKKEIGEQLYLVSTVLWWCETHFWQQCIHTYAYAYILTCTQCRIWDRRTLAMWPVRCVVWSTLSVSLQTRQSTCNSIRDFSVESPSLWVACPCVLHPPTVMCTSYCSFLLCVNIFSHSNSFPCKRGHESLTSYVQQSLGDII